MDNLTKLPGSSPTALRLSAAMLSAALATAALASGEAYGKVIGKQDVRWHAPDASQASFQGLDVFHGTTAATIKSIELDPWQDLEALADNWDANGAKAVSPDAILNAKRFLQSLTETSFTPFAHPDGIVGLESQKNGRAAYLLVSPTDKFTYVLRIGDTVHRGDDVDSSKMRELLALLY